MNETNELELLCSNWLAHFDAGDEIPAEDLCRDCPELLSALQQCIDQLRAGNAVSIGKIEKSSEETGWSDTVDDETVSYQRTFTYQPIESSCPELSVSPPGYDIMGKLGEGGMGVVYLARQVKANRIVALKMIRAKGEVAESEQERFVREARAVAKLQHPNIVQIHDVGEHDGIPFFSLEYCKGGSLSGKLDHKPLRADLAAVLVEKISRAVHVAHLHQIIHRDLKPANILLAPPAGGFGDSDSECWARNDTPKIADFGLAKNLDEAGQTVNGAILGTPNYMSPEQARGDTDNINALADVYALGGILYACLTGRPPFRGSGVIDTLMKVTHHVPDPPSRLNPSVPRDLDTICSKCLEKQPGSRYQSALEVADELRRWLEGEPILGRPVRLPERIGKWVRRRPIIAGLSAAIVFLLVLGITVSTILALNAHESEQKATTKAIEAFKARDDSNKKANLANSARLEAEAKQRHAEWLAYAGLIKSASFEHRLGNPASSLKALDNCPWNIRGWEHDYLFTTLRGGPAVRLRGHTGLCLCASFSESGDRLLTVNEDKVIRVWDVKSGKQLGSIGTPIPPEKSGVVLEQTDKRSRPDGKATNVGSRAGSSRIGSKREGEPLVITVEKRKRVRQARFSPDAELLLTLNDRGILELSAVEDGRHSRSYPKTSSSISCFEFSPNGARVVSGHSNGEVNVWATHTGVLIQTVHHNSESTSGQYRQGVSRVMFGPNGRYLVTGGQDCVVRLWDTETWRVRNTFRGHVLEITGLAFSAKEDVVASCSKDRSIKIWDRENGELLATCFGHQAPLTHIAFSPDSRRLVSSSEDRTVRIWAASCGVELLTIERASCGIGGVVFSPDGKQLFGSGVGQPHQDAELLLWKANDKQKVFTLHNVISTVSDLRYRDSGQSFVSSDAVSPLTVWDARDGNKRLSVVSESSPHSCLTISSNGKRVADRSGWGASVWDVDTGKRIFSREALVYGYPIHLSPDGRLLVMGTGSVTIWDVEKGQESSSLPMDPPLMVRLSPKGTRVACVHLGPENKKKAEIWDVRTKRRLCVLRGHTEPIHWIEFDSTGDRIVTSSSDKTAKVWSASTGRMLMTLGGHSEEVSCSRFSRDGKRIVTCSADTTLKIWDGKTGRLLRTLNGHGAPVTVADFHPDGTRIISSGSDRTIKVWHLND